jgi:chemotaxis protein methyltransferase CheR
MSAADPLASLERFFIERLGICIARSGSRPLLERFVAARVRALGAPSLDGYLQVLAQPNHPELQQLINATTVGLTWFFRDPEQLDALGQLIRSPGHRRPLSVWVAGCSSGEEVYSLAMLFEEAGIFAQILGTDVNDNLLAQARAARYSSWSLRALPAQHRHHLVALDDGRWEVRASLRRQASFLRHSLLEAPPLPPRGGHFDVVFCRNVLIYFHHSTVASAMANLARSLGAHGWLFLGASEMTRPAPGLTLVPVGERYAHQPAPANVAPRVAPLVAPRLAQPVATSLAATAPRVRSSAVSERLQHAHARFSAGALTEAAQLFAEVLALDPLCAEARMLLGIAYFRDGDLADAAHELRAALFLQPELWPAAFYLALYHQRTGDEAGARREFRRIVECADHAPPPGDPVLDELELWKPEVVATARRYLLRNCSTE